MPSYARIVKVPGKNSQELYDKVSTEIGRFMEKSNVGKFDVKSDPAKKQVSVSSSMFSATLHCEEGALRLEGKLSLMAMPFRSKIDEGIDKWMAKNFPA